MKKKKHRELRDMNFYLFPLNLLWFSIYFFLSGLCRVAVTFIANFGAFGDTQTQHRTTHYTISTPLTSPQHSTTQHTKQRKIYTPLISQLPQNYHSKKLYNQRLSNISYRISRHLASYFKTFPLTSAHNLQGLRISYRHFQEYLWLFNRSCLA